MYGIFSNPASVRPELTAECWRSGQEIFTRNHKLKAQKSLVIAIPSADLEHSREVEVEGEAISIY